MGNESEAEVTRASAVEVQGADKGSCAECEGTSAATIAVALPAAPAAGFPTIAEALQGATGVVDCSIPRTTPRKGMVADGEGYVDSYGIHHPSREVARAFAAGSVHYIDSMGTVHGTPVAGAVAVRVDAAGVHQGFVDWAAAHVSGDGIHTGALVTDGPEPPAERRGGSGTRSRHQVVFGRREVISRSRLPGAADSPPLSPSSVTKSLFPVTSAVPLNEAVSIVGATLAEAVKSATPSNSNPEGVCILAGHGASGSDAVNLYGTDQGFVVRFGELSYFFFGDSWASPGGVSQSTVDDDALGYTTDTPDSVACPVVHFFPASSSTTSFQFEPVHVEYGLNSSFFLGSLSTPGVGFATDQNIYTVVGSRDLSDPPVVAHTFALMGNLLAVRSIDPSKPTTFIAQNKIGDGMLDVAPDYFGLTDTVTLSWIDVNDQPHSQDCIIDRFRSTAFHAAPPGSYARYDAVLSGMARPVFGWGRPWFSQVYTGATGTTKVQGMADMYLMVLDGALLDAGAPPQYYYFAGLDESGAPLWQQFEGFNPPNPALLPVAILDENDEPAIVNTATVTYDADLGLWIMLYGGHSAYPPNTPASKGVWSPPYEPSQLGISLRVAANPWGPWSARILLWPPPASDPTWYFAGGTDIGTGPVQEPTNSALIPTQDIEARCYLLYDSFANDSKCAVSDEHNNATDYGEGFEYAAAIWHGVGKLLPETPLDPIWQSTTKELYFGMSTWNPYRVVLMKTIVGVKSSRVH